MAQQLSIFAEIVRPSPVRRLESTSDGATLWVKDDSRIHPAYGGNKCRKLAHLLRNAERLGKTRIATFGAAGSHHVLATGLLGKARGFDVRAFVVSQPWSAHAEQALCASVAAGVELVPVKSSRHAILAAAGLFDSASSVVPPGGTNVCGSLGYFEAAIELAQQVRRGELPEPDYVVVAFGTSGTAAGLLAGIEFAGLKSRVVGVSVLRAAGRAFLALRLANAILRSIGSPSSVRPDRLLIDPDRLGAGYGYESEPGRLARLTADSLDLPLDPTYTAKAFAGAWSLLKGNRVSPLDCARARTMPIAPIPPSNVLYWHTLSAHPPAQPATASTTKLPRSIRQLLRPCSQN